MKLVLGIALALLCNSAAYAKEPIKDAEGMYFQKIEMFGVGDASYLVDTVTQQCFITRGKEGIANVSCADLAKRKEWKPVLVWVK